MNLHSGNSNCSCANIYLYDLARRLIQDSDYFGNAQGELTTRSDRNGNVHSYSYDVLGRPISDAVTTLGAGVNGALRRLEVGYDAQGNPFLFTSYDAASGGNVVNQVQRDFNGLGQLTTEYQSHAGAVNTGTTPKVQYAYTEMAGGANHSRLVSMTYPNGRVLDYNYSSGLNDSISRLSSLSDTSVTLESLDYLGLGTVVRRAHPQPGVDLTYVKLSGEPVGDAGDQYVGTDRFGRVVDQRWLKTSTSVSTDRFQYGYDRNSNRLWRDNLVNAAFGELYAYDSLDQLSSFQRGTLNANKDGLVGLPSRNQAWNHDALGNFDSVLEEDVVLTRTHNRQNEITSIAGATAPTYDANGNQTTDETGQQLSYDAWNRLVKVKDSGGATLADFAYDALNRLAKKAVSGTTTDLYYSASWQLLEERVGGQTTIQYVWSPVYIDALVLRDRDADGNGSLEQRLYVQQDANFNVTALIDDSSGTVVERYASDPFGRQSVLAADWSPRAASLYDFRHGHQGLFFEITVGLHNNRGRWFDPVQMRFVTMDPESFGAGDPSLYRYEGNGPTVGLDPSGLFDLFKDVRAPEPGENVGDAAMELDAVMTRRSRMAAQGQTPPPLMAGSAPVYGSDGNRTAHEAMVQAGQLTQNMSRRAMLPFYVTPAAPVAIGAGLADDLSSGNYTGAALTVAIPTGLRTLPHLARGAKACAGRLGRSATLGTKTQVMNSAGPVGGSWYMYTNPQPYTGWLKPLNYLGLRSKRPISLGYYNHAVPGIARWRAVEIEERFHTWLTRHAPAIRTAGDTKVGGIPFGAPIKYVEEVIGHFAGEAGSRSFRILYAPFAPINAFGSLSLRETAFVGLLMFGGYQAYNDWPILGD